jgi:3-deoxy-D-glycero-D-galacto-nononate 9-phosphate synthase
MTYIIAEIGQNHNGSVSRAKELIKVAHNSGANAVKFTMRDLDKEMTAYMAGSPYESKHSYGRTYMDHRRVLELTKEDVYKLSVYAIETFGLDVVCTFCQDTLIKDPYIRSKIIPKLRYIKVASRDMTNTFLLDEINELGADVLLSTGMWSVSEVVMASLKLDKCDLTVMHCVSEYPATNAYMERIKELKEHFPKVGYSDHHSMTATMCAIQLGAEVVEAHITLDNKDKGSDHMGSYNPTDFSGYVRFIRWIPYIMLYDEKSFELSTRNAREKLARSISSSRDIKSGEVIKLEDLCLLSPGSGMSPYSMSTVVGCIAANDIPKNTHIKEEDLH